MNAAVIKIIVGALGAALLIGWAGWERNGRLTAEKEVIALTGRLELCAERTREQNRGVTALSNATIASNARYEELKRQRAPQTTALAASIARLEEKLKVSAEGKTCADRLKEWRNAQ